MTEKAVILNICDMIDMSIGTPENGVVDFNMLQQVLHCLAQQLGVRDTLVELRNPQLMTLSADHAHTVNVSEYAVDSLPATKDDPNPNINVTYEITKEDHKLGRAPSNSILIVERVKKSSFKIPEVSPVHGVTPAGVPTGGGTGRGTAGGPGEVRGGESGAPGGGGPGAPGGGGPGAPGGGGPGAPGGGGPGRASGGGVSGGGVPGRRQSAPSGRVPGQGPDGTPGGQQWNGTATTSDVLPPLPTITITPKDTDDLESIRRIIPLMADNLASSVVRTNELVVGTVTPPMRPILIQPKHVEDTEGIKQAISQMANTIDDINSKINELRAAQRAPLPSVSLQKVTLPTDGPDEMNGIKTAVMQVSQNLPTIVTLLNELSRAAAPSGPAGLSLVTNSRFNILESAVNDLKNRVYGTVPNNQDILEGVRSQTNVKAISDVWTQLNVSSRLEAAEAGLAKLSSLLQDLIVESGRTVPADFPSVTPPIIGISSQTPAPATRDQAGGGGIKSDGAKPATLQVPQQQPETPSYNQNKQDTIPVLSVLPGDIEDLEGLKRTTNKLIINLADVTNRVNELTDAMNRGQGGMTAPDEYITEGGTDGYYPKTDDGVGEYYPIPLGTSVLETTGGGVTPGSATPGGATEPIDTMRPSTTGPDGQRAPNVPIGGKPRRSSIKGRPGSSGAPPGISNRIIALEEKIKICCATVAKDNNMNKDMINSLQDQLTDLLKQVVMLKNQLDESKLSSDMIKHIDSVMDLVQTVQQMKGQLNEVYDTARGLLEEKSNRQGTMNSIIEQIEYLRTVKLDREDMQDAMAEKADLKMLARKVSFDQFEVACDDLARGLDQAIGKLSVQESLWQQALDDIQREIETKLDKQELSPLKDFFNDKLKLLQDNLKKMALLRRDVEAAGTKRKLLRDVHCISCDADVVMPLENAATATAKAMPPSHSMKPYLTYELDTIRKQQASHVKPRNMHDWEAIEKHMAKGPVRRPNSLQESHLCGRYCGGSHTVTTAAQRVARLGHFMKQWGPDVLPLGSALAAGDDGRMYKVTQEIPEPGGAEPTNIKPPPQKMEPTKEVNKPILLTPECRCLDAVVPNKA